MSITVVIPTCGRPESLKRCLSGLPAEADIIVTDDSRDQTTKQMLAAEYPHVRWFGGPSRGPAANRNHGAAFADSQWIAFLDDDCEPQPGWLDGLLACADGAEVVEGRTIAPQASDSPFEEHVENLQGGVLWSCNLAVRRDLFRRLRGFDEDFTEPAGEDMEFAWRVHRSGARVRFAAAAVVHHPPRKTGWKGILRRTRMRRWMALYRLKTEQADSAFITVAREAMDLLRSLAQVIRLSDRRRWRRDTFALLWRSVTLPYVVPLLLVWGKRFRRGLQCNEEGARERDQY